MYKQRSSLLGNEPGAMYGTLCRQSRCIFLGLYTQHAIVRYSLAAWAGLSQVQVRVATDPAGPEVHSLCPRLYPDTWLSDPFIVPGEPQPKLPTSSAFSETCQAQKAA